MLSPDNQTYVIYTSDNGFHMGERRMIAGKDTTYEEDIRVPMVLRGPGVPKGAHIDAVALNIDLAPTFADVAGIETPDFVDGRSFLPLLADPGLPGARASWSSAASSRSSTSSWQSNTASSATSSTGTPMSRACARPNGPIWSTVAASASCTTSWTIPTSSTT
jgi:N-acetylglucosamine-6-sulfatase